MRQNEAVTDNREPNRDRRLGRAIREAEKPALSAARLELLGTRIAAAASAVLEARRERAWWEWMTRWARTEVALAAAAALIAVALGGTSAIERLDAGADSATVATMVSRQTAAVRLDSVVTRALAAGASSEQVMNALVGQPTSEWLLTAAVVR